MAPAEEPAAPNASTDIKPATETLAAPAPDQVTEKPPAATATEHIAEKPAGADEAIRLPPPPAAPRRVVVTPERLARRFRILEVVLVVQVLALAFFVASFDVRNTDVWMSLATGRDFLAGKYSPLTGKDIYSWTTEGVYWVNHSWLYGVVLYGLNSVAGIPGLIVAKAVLITLLALVLVRTGQGGRWLWVPALCTALALVVMSPRLFLQPICVSLLLLGLTLYFLQRGGGWLHAPGRELGAVTWMSYWPLLVLFAAWANLDEWFFLGPLTVALYALGQAVQPRDREGAPRPGELRALGLTLLLGVGACLLNPHHVHVFSLPVSLGLTGPAAILKEDPQFKGLFYSPFDPGFFGRGWGSLTAAHAAWFPLVLLGLLSFALEARSLRWWRVLTFGVFLALGAWHARAVPFFAVVAAPVTALNFYDWAARRYGTELRTQRNWRRGLTAVRVLGVCAMVAVLVVAWPGWLHRSQDPRTRDVRRVSFGSRLDPSLEQVAREIKILHKRGVLGEDSRGLNFSPDVANALAWYCPEEKGFFDYRYALFTGVAEDWVALRRRLLERDPAPSWRVLVRRYSPVWARWAVKG